VIHKPGIYLDISEKDYHADPVIVPSLSSSIAGILYEQSALHAQYAHPRLRPPAPDEIEETKRPTDVGSAVHKFMLGRGREVQLIAFDDYKKTDARTQRDTARVGGKIPILQSDFEDVEMVTTSITDRLVEMGRGDLFKACDTEVTLVWQENNGVWCRARLDALPKDAGEIAHLRLPELKTTAGSADIESWTGPFFSNGNDIQASFYKRGLHALLPMLASVEFEWVVAEQKPPYAVNILTASNQASEEADQVVEHAIAMWGRCMAAGQWPGYDGGIIETTQWRSMRRGMRNMALLERLKQWQAPHE
jgi:hypothetical protein